MFVCLLNQNKWMFIRELQYIYFNMIKVIAAKELVFEEDKSKINEWNVCIWSKGLIYLISTNIFKK